jgi:hypothetical protein
MGEAGEHDAISLCFRLSAEELMRQRGVDDVLVAHNQFFAWVEEHPLVRVSPDVYLLDGPIPRPLPRSWQLWIPGHRPPRFALEVVSEEWKKDYDDNPPKYAQLGCRELVICDPDLLHEANPNPRRVTLQAYRRGEDGAFVKVYSGPGPYRSQELQADVLLRFEGPVVRLRLSFDPEGRELVPIPQEAREQAEREREQAEREREQAEREREQAEREREQAEREREQAERERDEERSRREELELELERLQAQLKGSSESDFPSS